MWIAGGLSVVLILLWIFNRWVENELVRRLESSPYRISMESVRVQAGRGTIVFHRIGWSQDSSYVKAEQVRVSGVSILKYLVNQKLFISQVRIDRPETCLVLREKQESKIFEKFDSFEIGKLLLTNGKVIVRNKDTALQPIRMSVPFLEVESLRTDSIIIRESIPFRYGNHRVKMDRFYYQIDSLYELSAAFADLENEQMEIDSLRISPRYERQEFQQKIPFQKTRADLVVPRVEIRGMKLYSLEEGMVFRASALVLDSADLELYRDKRLPENPVIKPMYSKMIRDLSPGLAVDSVLVRGGQIRYEILFGDQREAGKIYFEDLDGEILHVTNQGMYQEEFPGTRVKAEARFMEKTKVGLHWSFSVDAPDDAFHVAGFLSRIGEEDMNLFLKPAFHVSVQGAIEELRFDFSGDDYKASGEMRMMYDELKFEWLKEDGQEKHKVLSAVTNMFLKNKMTGPAEKENIEVERVRTKSFWAYLWKMIQTGSLEFLL